MKKTSRERLIMALDHKDPGQVVVDLGATSTSGINANTLIALRQALHLDDTPVTISEPLQLLGRVEEDVRAALHIDVVGVAVDSTIFGFENTGWKPWAMPSGQKVLVPENFRTTVDASGYTYIYPQGDVTVPPSAKMPKGGNFFDNITRVDEDFDEDDANAREDFAEDFKLYTDAQLRRLEARCNELYNNTQYGLIGGGALAGLGDFATIPGPAVKHPKGIRELTDFMVAHHTLPNYIHELFEMQLEVALKNAALFHQAVGDKIQAIQISGTDFGIQTGPYLSPDFYREFYKPYHTAINSWVHQNTNWKTFFHSCGSVVDFLDDFCEAGVDILNPVQTSAAGMDARMLKEKWGDRLVFWGGGISTQSTLPFGTAAEVYQEALDTLAVFAPGGGYVFNAIHNIQAGTPVENVVALFKAVEDYNSSLGV